MSSQLVKKLLPFLASALLAAGVAGHADAAPRAAKKPVAATSETTDNDPLEPYNRGMFWFNQTLDQFLIRPITYGYRSITPQVIRNRVGHFGDNLYEPVNMVNALLQGDFTQGVTSFWRFIINSTVGLAGLNDVATEAGLQERREDFGQTLAVWGADSGPYIVWPLIGPSNLRDSVGRVVDWFATDPVQYFTDTPTSIGIAAGEGLVARDRLFEAIDDVNSSSLDPYVSYRSIYEQNRKARIENRNRDKTKL